jgi:hypothetical protein
VGRILGVGPDLGVGVTLGVAVGVGVAVAVGVCVGVGVWLAVAVAVGVGVGVGVPVPIGLRQTASPNVPANRNLSLAQDASTTGSGQVGNPWFISAHDAPWSVDKNMPAEFPANIELSLNV